MTQYTTAEHVAQTVEIAWTYMQLGFPCFLVGPRKIPRIPKTDRNGWGNGHLSATLDPEVFGAMCEAYKDSYVAISFHSIAACAIDVDVNDGKVGAETIANLVAIHGELPECPRQKSKSGGYHLIFGVPKGVKLAQQLGQHVDCKKRGYICADPRLGYSWEVGLVAVADAVPIPTWMAKILTREAVVRPAASIERAEEVEGAGRWLASFWPRESGTDLGLGFVSCGRHEFAGAVAGYVLARGLRRGMAEALVEVAARAAGDEEVEDRVRAVGDTWSKVRRGEPVTGKGVLESVLGEEGLEELDGMLGLVWSPARTFLIRWSDEEGRRLLARWKEEWFTWADGLWSPMSKESMQNAIWRHLEATRGADGPKPSIRLVSETIRELESIEGVGLDDGADPPFWADGRTTGDLVPVANGLLDLMTGEVAPHDPGLFVLSRIPVEYREDADIGGPRFHQYLDEVLPRDTAAWTTLKKWAGVHLEPRPGRCQKALLMIGVKRGGKGTFLDLMLLALGGLNHCIPMGLEDFDDDFGLAEAVGKRAMIISDARLERAPKTMISRLLRITSNEPVRVRRKQKSAALMRLGTRVTIAMNPPVPKLNDPEGAIASRFVVVSFRESFLGREDPVLGETLATELPEFLRWMVEGWRELVADKYRLETPASGRQHANDLLEATSDIRGFYNECVRENQDGFAPRAALWGLWNRWANQNNTPIGSNRAFLADFRAVSGAAREGKLHGDRGFYGIEIL